MILNNLAISICLSFYVCWFSVTVVIATCFLTLLLQTGTECCYAKVLRSVCNFYVHNNKRLIASLGVCPVGQPPVQCKTNPCLNAKCEQFPQAKCRPDYCGGCRAKFYFGNFEIPDEKCRGNVTLASVRSFYLNLCLFIVTGVIECYGFAACTDRKEKVFMWKFVEVNKIVFGWWIMLLHLTTVKKCFWIYVPQKSLLRFPETRKTVTREMHSITSVHDSCQFCSACFS